MGKYGKEKYFEMLRLLEDENAIKLTRNTVLPNFLKNAIENLRPEAKLSITLRQ